MNAVSALDCLGEKATRRLFRLRGLIDTFAPPIQTEKDRVVAFAAIEALNLWDSFARSYYLSCVFGAKLRSGSAVRLSLAGLRTADAAVRSAMASAGRRAPIGGLIRRRDEPSWHDVQLLLKLFQYVGASHLAQLQSALSYPTDVFRFLPTVRNFFAHRNRDTAHKVRDAAPLLGVLGPSKPSDIVCSWRANRPQNILADWLDDMRTVILLMCL